MLPWDLAGFCRFHAGETMLVCGCGPSLNQAVAPERYVSIGVNDVGRLFQPNYLVVLNSRRQFRGDRFQFVEESRAEAVFTHLNLGIRHPHVVPVRLGTRGGVEFGDPSVLHFGRDSTYLALCLAIHMGATRVGLIGVDFTDDHFFGRTGRHPLAGDFETIDRDYARLAAACGKLGVEVLNLGMSSRLTAFPKMDPLEFTRLAPQRVSTPQRRIFFVNFVFRSCGETVGAGLGHAATSLGIPHQIAREDDPLLPERVKDFSPDLLFVVHGRNFVRRWGKILRGIPSAVWLLDEPYEVDDTGRYSGWFDTVFVNDRATLARHRNAHYLAACYDPWEHWYRPADERKYRVGFVGGANPERERILRALARRKLLDYVAGGPWRAAELRCLEPARWISPGETASLYRQTRIVLNIFRTQHQFNRHRTAGTSLNPRVYEAAACGALVVSGDRPELTEVWPEAPLPGTAEEWPDLVGELLGDAERFEKSRRSLARRIHPHTFTQRLRTILELTAPERPAISLPTQHSTRGAKVEGWNICGDISISMEDGAVVLNKVRDDAPGSEAGLESDLRFADVSLSCEVFLYPETHFLAKIHHADSNPLSNSYHLCRSAAGTYFARHQRVFFKVALPILRWAPVVISNHNGWLAVTIEGKTHCAFRDRTLPEGHCFLGVKGGRLKLRNIEIRNSTWAEMGQDIVPPPAYSIVCGTVGASPDVSIITTVYDRSDCLEHCIRSVECLNFKSYEHIIVADGPPEDVLGAIRKVVERHAAPGNRMLANLALRHNNWGIAPAAAGLAIASGKYVAFLSDDNGYSPDHLDPLVAALDQEPRIGFAYSSCLYNGRRVLNSSIPRAGAIDLGQPLFRRDLLDLHFKGTLPFDEMAWDWRLIERLLRAGVKWRHINRPTFIFRLSQYPRLILESR